MKITLQRTSPNYRQKLSTQRIMRDLTIGLLVIVAYSLFYQFTTNGSDYGIQAALIYVVSVVTALVTETVWALIHKSNILEHIKNSFPLVTSIIFALTLPIGTPLYVVAIGSFIAIFFGKLVYGGFGSNIFNPALVGRVVVHLAFGGSLTTTLSTGSDAVSTATPAAMLAATKWMGGSEFSYKLMDLFLGNHGGTLGETCIWIILVVGVLLAIRKVFDWRIPVAYLGTVAILAEVYALMNGLDPLTYPLIHLCIGGVVFGAVIMATDPVTSPTSPLGKILFGIGLGFLTVIIRLKANYPEGVLFSILMMNMLTPWIDSLILGRTHKNTAKQWMVIALCLVVASGCVYGAGTSIQNQIAIENKKAEEAKKKAEEAAKKKAEEEANSFNWKVLSTSGNTYTMEVEGYMNPQSSDPKPMKIAVTVDGDKVKSVKMLEYPSETEYFGLDLIEGKSSAPKQKAFYDKFLANEFAVSDIDGVDTSTGATFTTKGIVSAIRQAIAASK